MAIEASRPIGTQDAASSSAVRPTADMVSALLGHRRLTHPGDRIRSFERPLDNAALLRPGGHRRDRRCGGLPKAGGGSVAVAR